MSGSRTILDRETQGGNFRNPVNMERSKDILLGRGARGSVGSDRDLNPHIIKGSGCARSDGSDPRESASAGATVDTIEVAPGYAEGYEDRSTLASTSDRRE